MYYKVTKEMLTGINLAQFFTLLQTEEAITSLDLSNIDFSLWADEAFRDLFNNLPESVKKIDLSRCNLSKLSENSLDVLLGRAATIAEYNLSGNNLGSLEGMKFYERFPRSVLLNLSDNNLHVHPELLAERLKKIANCSVLDLSNNQLDTIPINILTQALNGVSIRTLVLNDNNLYTHNLKSLLSAISPRVSFVKLEWNYFDALTSNELSEAIKAIPKNVKEVSFKHNRLDLGTMRKVIDTISADLQFKQELQVRWTDQENREMYFIFNSTDKTYNGKIFNVPALNTVTPNEEITKPVTSAAGPVQPAAAPVDADTSPSSYLNLQWLYALGSVSAAALAAGIAAILLVTPVAIGISLSTAGGVGLLAAAYGLFTYKPTQSDLPQQDAAALLGA